jgi:protease-4
MTQDTFWNNREQAQKFIDEANSLRKKIEPLLVAEKKIKSDLPVRDFKLTPQFGDLTFLRAAASIAFNAVGLSSIARQIEQAGVAQAVDQLSLDGMLALWRPAASN